MIWWLESELRAIRGCPDRKEDVRWLFDVALGVLPLRTLVRVPSQVHESGMLDKDPGRLHVSHIRFYTSDPIQYFSGRT